jgi:hypothetical protein
MNKLRNKTLSFPHYIARVERKYVNQSFLASQQEKAIISKYIIIAVLEIPSNSKQTKYHGNVEVVLYTQNFLSSIVFIRDSMVF